MYGGRCASSLNLFRFVKRPDSRAFLFVRCMAVLSIQGTIVQDFCVVEFDARAYSLLAIQKACHRFSNRASFDVHVVQTEGTNAIKVTLQLLKGTADDLLTELVQLLQNEALEQQLREQIRTQTEGVRNLVLAYAFSRTGLIAQDGAKPVA